MIHRVGGVDIELDVRECCVHCGQSHAANHYFQAWVGMFYAQTDAGKRRIACVLSSDSRMQAAVSQIQQNTQGQLTGALSYLQQQAAVVQQLAATTNELRRSTNRRLANY